MGLDRRDRLTLLLEFTARNLAMTAVIGNMVLGRVEFVLFATLFFLTQIPIVLLTVAACAYSSSGGDGACGCRRGRATSSGLCDP